MTCHLYEQSIKKWGIESQLNMLQEECGELIVAVNKLRRSKYRRKSYVAEEMADVRILIDQVILGLDISKQVNKCSEFKLKRLARRLKK